MWLLMDVNEAYDCAVTCLLRIRTDSMSALPPAKAKHKMLIFIKIFENALTLPLK